MPWHEVELPQYRHWKQAGFKADSEEFKLVSNFGEERERERERERAACGNTKRERLQEVNAVKFARKGAIVVWQVVGLNANTIDCLQYPSVISICEDFLKGKNNPRSVGQTTQGSQIKLPHPDNNQEGHHPK